VDDHPLALVGLRALIEANPDLEIVAEMTDIESALPFFKSAPPLVAVIDVPMPGLTVAGFARHCSELWQKSKVIVATARDDTDVLDELLQSGAHGYLLKRSIPTELIRAIRIVTAGNVYVDPAIGSRLLVRTSPDAAASTALSERERVVLKLVARGFSSKEMAAELGLSIKTVQTYKVRAMKKLDLRTRAAIVRYGAARGWMDEI